MSYKLNIKNKFIPKDFFNWRPFYSCVIIGSPDPILKGRIQLGILSFHTDELPPGIPGPNDRPPGRVDRKRHRFPSTECCLILFPGAVEFGPVAAAKSCRTFPLWVAPSGAEAQIPLPPTGNGIWWIRVTSDQSVSRHTVTRFLHFCLVFPRWLENLPFPL